MNNRPLVHIGYHKTASTWLQQVLFPAVRNAALVPRTVAIETFIETGALQFDPEAARQRLESAVAGRRPILSLETLSGYLHNGGLSGALSKDMAHRLRATLPDADIVVFIRRQPDILAASYAQYVRYGGTHSLRRYLFPREYNSLRHARRDKMPRFELDHFAYLPLLQLYRELFGPGRVHVYLYEALHADRESFVEAFSRALDLDCPALPQTDAPHNPSLSPLAQAVVRRVNLFTMARVHDKTHFIHLPGMFWVGRGAGRALSRLFPGPRGSDLSRLAPPDLVRRIEAYYAGTNRELADEFGLPLAEHGYPLPDADAAAAANQSKARGEAFRAA